MQKTTGGFKSLSDMEKRVRLIDGRMPVDRTDGLFEALVTQNFLHSAKRDLGEELLAESADKQLSGSSRLGLSTPIDSRCLPAISGDR